MNNGTMKRLKLASYIMIFSGYFLYTSLGCYCNLLGHYNIATSYTYACILVHMVNMKQRIIVAMLYILHRTILWSMMVLMPLLGISWILGLFFIIDGDSVAFAWIFTIVNSLQVRT